MHAADRLDGLGTHLVADADCADEDEAARRKRAVRRNRALIDGERQHADGTRRKSVDTVRDRRPIRQRLLLAVRIVIRVAEREDFLGCALRQGHAVLARDLGQGILVLAAKRHGVLDLLVHLRAVCRDEAEDRVLRRIAADSLLAVDDGARIVAHAEVHELLKSRAQLAVSDILRARTVDESDGFELSLRDRARLIAEKEVQAARRLDARDLSDEHVVFEHLAHVLRRDDGDHQRQTLGHGDDDDDDGEHDGVDEVMRDDEPVRTVRHDTRHIEAVVDDEALKHEGDGDRHAADVAEVADLMREVRELHLEWRVAILVRLQLARDLAVERLVAERRRAHHSVAAADDGAAEHFVRVEEVRAFLRFLIALCRRRLCRFLRLAVQYRLIDLNRAVANDAVRRDLVARLQQHEIAHDDLVDGNLRQRAVAVDLTLNERRFLLQLLERILVLILRIRRDRRREDHGERNARGLIPCDLPEDRKDDVDDERHAENLDDRIVKTPLELLPEALAFLLRDAVRTVPLARRAHLFICQTLNLHKRSP